MRKTIPNKPAYTSGSGTLLRELYALAVLRALDDGERDRVLKALNEEA